MRRLSLAALALLLATTAHAGFGSDPRFTNNVGGLRWRGAQQFSGQVTYSNTVIFEQPIQGSATGFTAAPLEGDGSSGDAYTLTLCAEGETYVISGGVWTCQAAGGGGSFVEIAGSTMTGALALAPGSAALPSLFWNNAEQSGFYQSAVGRIGIALDGFAAYELQAGTMTAPAQHGSWKSLDVAAAVKAQSYQGNGAALTGILPLGGGTMTGQLQTTDGTQAAPGIGVGAADTGFFGQAFDAMSATVNNTLVQSFTENDVTFEVPVLMNQALTLTTSLTVGTTFGSAGGTAYLQEAEVGGMELVHDPGSQFIISDEARFELKRGTAAMFFVAVGTSVVFQDPAGVAVREYLIAARPDGQMRHRCVDLQTDSDFECYWDFSALDLNTSTNKTLFGFDVRTATFNVAALIAQQGGTPGNLTLGSQEGTGDSILLRGGNDGTTASLFRMRSYVDGEFQGTIIDLGRSGGGVGSEVAIGDGTASDLAQIKFVGWDGVEFSTGVVMLARSTAPWTDSNTPAKLEIFVSTSNDVGMNEDGDNDPPEEAVATFTSNSQGARVTVLNMLQLPAKDSPPSACTSEVQGSVYHDSTTPELCWCNGSSWTAIVGIGNCS